MICALTACGCHLAKFVIDLDERRLFSNGHEIRLTPKAFDLLRLLIESRPKALSKQEITLRSQRRIPGLVT